VLQLRGDRAAARGHGGQGRDDQEVPLMVLTFGEVPPEGFLVRKVSGKA
jgi:hypothetical protein